VLTNPLAGPAVNGRHENRFLGAVAHNRHHAVTGQSTVLWAGHAAHPTHTFHFCLITGQKHGAAVQFARDTALFAAAGTLGQAALAMLLEPGRPAMPGHMKNEQRPRQREVPAGVHRGLRAWIFRRVHQALVPPRTGKRRAPAPVRATCAFQGIGTVASATC